MGLHVPLRAHPPLLRPMLLLRKVPIEIVPQLLNQMNAQQKEMRTTVPSSTTTTTFTTITTTRTLHPMLTCTSITQLLVTCQE